MNMKKVIKTFVMAAAITMAMSLVSCGDNEEPDPVVVPSTIESVYKEATDVHYVFKTQDDAGTGTIEIYNVQFTIGDRKSPPLNISIEAPITIKNGVVTYEGTNIIPSLMMQGVNVPAPDYVVTNLKAVVDVTKAMTYEISFDCHGGSFHDIGNLKNAN